MKTVESYLHDPEIVADFVSEVAEHLDTAAEVALAAESGDPEALKELRRVIHTIKGAAGFVGLDVVSELCHWLEEMLLRQISAEGAARPEHFDQVHEATDLLRAWMVEVERCCQERDSFRAGDRAAGLIAELRERAA